MTLFPPVRSHLITTNRTHCRRYFWRCAAALCAASFDMLLVTHASGCGSFFKMRMQSEQFQINSRFFHSSDCRHSRASHFEHSALWARVAALFSCLCKPECCCSAAPACDRAAFHPRPAHARIHCGNSKALQIITKPPAASASNASNTKMHLLASGWLRCSAPSQRVQNTTPSPRRSIRST